LRPSERQKALGVRSDPLSSFVILLPELGVQVIDLSQRAAEIVLELPPGVVSSERLQIGNPPAVIPPTRTVDELAGHLFAGDTLAHGNCFENRAAVRASPADVVDTRGSRCTVKLRERAHEVGAVDVVAHLLAAVAVDGVRLPGYGAPHEIRQEAVKLSTGVVGAS